MVKTSIAVGYAGFSFCTIYSSCKHSPDFIVIDIGNSKKRFVPKGSRNLRWIGREVRFMEFGIVGFLVFTGLFLYVLHRVIASAVQEGINNSRLFKENPEDEPKQD